MRAAALVLAGVAGLAACGSEKDLPLGPGPDVPDPSATFSRVQEEVLTASCALAGCHAGAAPQGGLDLSPGVAYGATVRVASTQQPALMRIAPGDADASYLVKKMRGDPDISGSPMPLGSDAPEEARKLVIDWVRRGAPND